jgi:hypothetical protein
LKKGISKDTGILGTFEAGDLEPMRLEKQQGGETDSYSDEYKIDVF